MLVNYCIVSVLFRKFKWRKHTMLVITHRNHYSWEPSCPTGIKENKTLLIGKWIILVGCKYCNFIECQCHGKEPRAKTMHTKPCFSLHMLCKKCCLFLASESKIYSKTVPQKFFGSPPLNQCSFQEQYTVLALASTVFNPLKIWRTAEYFIYTTTKTIISNGWNVPHLNKFPLLNFFKTSMLFESRNDKLFGRNAAGISLFIVVFWNWFREHRNIV